MTTTHSGKDVAGVVVLTADGSTAFADDVAKSWIDELGGHEPVISAVAAGTARVRTESGRWLAVRASALADGPGAQVAVMIEPARPHELAPLVADGYGLTERERDVTQLVARGLCTNAIAARLHLSPWTVQDHLKAIFEKAGVTTRGELVAHVYFQQDVPDL